MCFITFPAPHPQQAKYEFAACCVELRVRGTLALQLASSSCWPFKYKFMLWNAAEEWRFERMKWSGESRRMLRGEGGNKANGRGEGKRMTAGGIAALLLGCLLEADASPSLLPVSSSSLLYPSISTLPASFILLQTCRFAIQQSGAVS